MAGNATIRCGSSGHYSPYNREVIKAVCPIQKIACANLMMKSHHVNYQFDVANGLEVEG